jgi:hypothetical protein
LKDSSANYEERNQLFELHSHVAIDMFEEQTLEELRRN